MIQQTDWYTDTTSSINDTVSYQDRKRDSQTYSINGRNTQKKVNGRRHCPGGPFFLQKKRQKLFEFKSIQFH